MFTEKNLPRLIIATPIILVLLFALLVIYFFIKTQYSNFHADSQKIEYEYLLRQKNILKNENRRVLEYISYHRKAETKRIHNKFRELVRNGEIITNEVVSEYEKKSTNKLKAQVIDWIQSIRYETNGYVWVHDTSHRLVAHPFRQDSIGADDTNNTDATGAKIFQQFINAATKSNKGDFVDYYWSKPEFGVQRKKIGYLALDEEWGWVVGTGLYTDDIESSLMDKKRELEEKIEKYIQIILLTAFSIMIVLGVISFLISKNIVRVFTEYRLKVSKKELALKEFNKLLKSKVEEAVSEAKKKDKALLQQSRLAQMGEMISMIAHQWRQPLSEISGIFMELETASKFGKANSELIQKESIDGNRLISYMSKTIDDFRDFFKPAKTKELFSVKRACEEAITLSEASLKSRDINLSLHVKGDVHVEGYASEFAQVVLNLILNAKDALKSRNITEPQITIVITKDEESTVIKVSDNAKGIDPEVLLKVFEPYFSTKKKSGTGLGLYMSKMIIEDNMGGKLSVENGKKGAVFCIKI